MVTVSIYELKPSFQALLRPFAAGLCRLGVKANQVTIAACAVSVAVGATLVLHPSPAFFAIVPAWLFLRMALNAIDGMLAREFGQASALGAYLNELTDVISDTALYVPFAFLPDSGPWLVGAVIVLSLISEMTGVLGVMIGASRRYDGPMGKSDRAFVFGLIALLVACNVPVAAALAWIWAVLALLLVLTIVKRVRGGLIEIGGKA
jgi:CDP-diacylglycerol--glycerol-3-phosphate 3-phosphatidyltransferase